MSGAEDLETMRRACKIVAVDFDGVIVESTSIKRDAIRMLFSDHAAALPDVLEFDRWNHGVPRTEKITRIYREILRLPLTNDALAGLCTRFAELVVDAVVACPLIRGAEEFLRTVSQKMPIYVVSATPETELVYIVERRGLSRNFSGIYGSPKVKTHVLGELQRAHGLHSQQVLFIGDSFSDYNSARESQVSFIGISRSGEHSQFPAEVPIYSDLMELLPVLTSQIMTESGLDHG
jgi:HAD superfamily hydrolase (TIGR01549 family)